MIPQLVSDKDGQCDKLCHTKSIVSVNGQFPGPKIVAREGDRVVVEVLDHGQHLSLIHI